MSPLRSSLSDHHTPDPEYMLQCLGKQHTQSGVSGKRYIRRLSIPTRRLPLHSSSQGLNVEYLMPNTTILNAPFLNTLPPSHLIRENPEWYCALTRVLPLPPPPSLSLYPAHSTLL
jgi:hypothetical protein